MAVAALLLACGKNDGNHIAGHWRAEHFAAQGLSVPMGPEFEVTATELRTPGGEFQVPISAIVAKGNDVTLQGPMSVGLSFHFEDADRISLHLPIIGKLYYRRVSSPQQIAAQGVQDTSSVPGPAAGVGVSALRDKSAPAASPVSTPIAAAATADPMGDYRQAIASMRMGDADSAVRQLQAGLQHGFRRFDLLDASAEFAPLKSDPRYMALMARYR